VDPGYLFIRWGRDRLPVGEIDLRRGVLAIPDEPTLARDWLSHPPDRSKRYSDRNTLCAFRIKQAVLEQPIQALPGLVAEDRFRSCLRRETPLRTGWDGHDQEREQAKGQGTCFHATLHY